MKHIKFEETDKVFLITIDALRYDVIEEDEVETPNIDKIRKEGLDFKRAFSNGFATRFVFPSILYGLKDNEVEEAPSEKSIAEYFNDIGYETIGITSNPYTSSYFGYNSGFDNFIDYIKPTKEKEKSIIFRWGRKIVKKFGFIYDKITSYRAKHDLPYERAETINQSFLDNLISDKKQFIWAHYMEPHAPYSPPREYRKECPEAWDRRGELTNKLYSEQNISNEDSENLWKLYLAEIKYLDDKIGELLNRLNELDEEYTLFLTSDHGEEFGERGRYQHNQFFEFNIHVPFTLYQPHNEELKGERNDIASHLDILPTLTSIYNIDVERDGIDLFSKKRSNLEITFNDNFVRITDEWKLIETPEENYLFDISASLEENENLYESKGKIVEDLKNKKNL